MGPLERLLHGKILKYWFPKMKNPVSLFRRRRDSFQIVLEKTFP
jgi:hypothetical protein